MTRMRSVMVMGLLALAVVVAAVMVVPRESGGPGESERLVPDLASRVNDVAVIDLESANGSARIVRGEGGWAVESHHGYPADAGLVRQLIIGMSESVIVEPKTDDPARYHHLGLADVSDADSAAVRVTLRDDGGEDIAAVLVGDAEGDDRYVRRIDDPRAFQVSAIPTVPGIPVDWLDRTLLDVERGAIARIEVRGTGGDVVLVRGEDGAMALEDLPAGRKVRFQYALDDFPMTLADLRFEDVRPADGLAFDGEFGGRVVLDNGLAFTFESADEDGQKWLRLRAATDTAMSGAAAAGEDAADAGAAEESAADESADPAQAAARYNARFDGWAYRLGETEMRRLSKPLSDLVEDEAADEAASNEPGEEPAQSPANDPAADSGETPDEGDAPGPSSTE